MILIHFTLTEPSPEPVNKKDATFSLQEQSNTASGSSKNVIGSIVPVGVIVIMYILPLPTIPKLAEHVKANLNASKGLNLRDIPAYSDLKTDLKLGFIYLFSDLSKNFCLLY